jgi:hypothetical protein
VEAAACSSETLVQDYKASHPEDPNLKTSKERIRGREANQSPIVLLSHLISCSTDENAGSGGLFPKVLPTMGVTDRTTITSRLQGK